MTKLQTKVDNLLRYTHSEKDTQILNGLRQYGSIKKLVKNTDFKERTVQRRLAAMQENAERFCYSPEFPETSLVADMPVFARSYFQSFPEPRADGVKGIWHKVKAEDVTLVEAVKAAVAGLHAEPIAPTKMFKTKTTDTLAMLTIADAHLGLLAYEGETGEEWNMDMSLDLLKTAVAYLVAKMDFIDLAVLHDAGDMTHTDGLISKTPKSGNALDSSDRYFAMCRAAKELLRFTIAEMLKKAKRVKVVSSRGNHNDQTAWHVNENLIEAYSKEPRVIIEPNDAYTQIFEWKKNLLVFTHGDAAKNAQMYEYIHTKWAPECGRTTYQFVGKGHVHHEIRESIGNTMFETFSSLTKSDAYHEFKMYKALRSMHLINFHPEGGEDSRFTYLPRYS